MSEEVGALGNIASGALVARAAGPAAGGVPVAVIADGTGHTAEGACLNCGTPLAGPHCHHCGQRAHVHRTIGAFAHDLLHGVLHFEGKTWRTLPMLAWRPGQLTREYIDGKRASYVSPIALFLFVVFLSFAAFNAFGGVHLGETIEADAARGLADARAAVDDRIDEQEAARRQALSRGRPVTEIDARLGELRRDRAALATVTLEGGEDDEVVRGDGPGGDAVATGLNAAWRKAKENPALLVYKMQSNAYKYSWMLIPLSVPFVWLLFPFDRRFGAYDHTVFTTYSITFMIALAALASVFIYEGLGAIGAVLLLYAPVHMYRQLRGAYGLGRFGAGWRMLALSLFAWVAIALFPSMTACWPPDLNGRFRFSTRRSF